MLAINAATIIKIINDNFENYRRNEKRTLAIKPFPNNLKQHALEPILRPLHLQLQHCRCNRLMCFYKAGM
jgi:hypothetical protein